MLIGAVIIALLFVTPLLFAATSNPIFCGFCHEMSPSIESWQESSHANVTCYGCHGAQNIPSLIYHKLKALNELRLHITGFEQPINVESHLSKESSEMSISICNRCHSITNRKVSAFEGIIINHKVHNRKGIACTICHNRVAHLKANEFLSSDIKEETSKRYENHLEMKYCMDCHTGKANAGPRECSTCHPKGFELKPESHKKANFFPEIHGKTALKDKKYCQSCHFEEKLCINCHKIEIPHPSDGWKNKVKGKENKHHSVTGKADPESCRMCHKEADFCDSCHHNNKTGKPWIEVHMKRVLKQGAAQPCFECHNALMCAHCHTQGKKD